MEDISTYDIEFNRKHPTKLVKEFNSEISTIQKEIDQLRVKFKKLTKERKESEIWEKLQLEKELYVLWWGDEFPYLWKGYKISKKEVTISGYYLSSHDKRDFYNVDVECPDKGAVIAELIDEYQFDDTIGWSIDNKLFHLGEDEISYNKDDINYGDWDEPASINGSTSATLFYIRSEEFKRRAIYIMAFNKKYQLTGGQLRASSVLAKWYQNCDRSVDNEYQVKWPLIYQPAFEQLYKHLTGTDIFVDISITGKIYLQIGILANVLEMENFIMFPYKGNMAKYVLFEDCLYGSTVDCKIIKEYCLKLLISETVKQSNIKKFDQLSDQIKELLNPLEIKMKDPKDISSELRPTDLLFLRFYPTDHDDREILYNNYMNYYSLSSEQMINNTLYGEKVNKKIDKFLPKYKLVVTKQNILIFIPKSYSYDFYFNGITPYYKYKLLKEIIIIYECCIEGRYGPKFPYNGKYGGFLLPSLNCLCEHKTSSK